MLPLEEAQARVLSGLAVKGCEWVGLDQALGRFLGTDLVAKRTQPPMDVSAMDGYAVRAVDCAQGRVLRLVGEIPAGKHPPGRIGPDETMRIFTGAAVPEGADAILIQENATQSDEGVMAQSQPKAGQFIRGKGLDFEPGKVGLAAGQRVDPRAVGLAASYGHAWLRVRQRPRVGILATGDELARPGDLASPNAIISSNSPALVALVKQWGGLAIDLGIAKDDPSDLISSLSSTEGLDLVVTSGGASVGAYDLIRPVLQQEGLSLDFWKIAMRPGKPLIFGDFRGTPLLGLPGNPVSASVCAIMFLRPMIAAMMGGSAMLRHQKGVLTMDLKENDERQDFLRAKLAFHANDGWLVEPYGKQDSSMYNSFATAGALAVRPPFDPARKAGDAIDFIALADVVSM